MKRDAMDDDRDDQHDDDDDALFKWKRDKC